MICTVYLYEYKAAITGPTHMIEKIIKKRGKIQIFHCISSNIKVISNLILK